MTKTIQHGVLIFSSLFIFGCATPAPLPSEVTPEKPVSQEKYQEPASPLPEGFFAINSSGNFFGEFFIKGYVTTESIPEAFCFENCAEYNAIFLNALEISNRDFQDFLEENKGASDQTKLILGCLTEDGQLTATNDSNEHGMIERELSREETQELLKGTQKNPLLYRLEKLDLDGGRGAPTCYSHFYTVEVTE